MDFLFAVRTLQKGNAYAILAQTMVLYYRKRKIGSHTDFKSFPVNPLAGRLTACFFFAESLPGGTSLCSAGQALALQANLSRS